MLAYWPYILLALLLLVLVTAAFLYFVLRRARLRAAPKRAVPSPLKVEGPETGGLYSPLTALGLKTSFARAMKLLRAHVTRRDYRYKLPWFLMVGESGSGKTSALADSGMEHPLGQPENQFYGVRQPLNWFFFDRGVVLDVAGDIVLRHDGEASNQHGWNQLSRLLQKHRPERPLDGVVLTIPCKDLLDAGGLDGRARVEQKAACLYRKLWQAQKLLGMSFPVYVLVTKCDEMAGFRSLCRELPASAREEMFGWSSPYTRETAYRSEWVEEAFQNVQRYLFQLQVEVFAERGDVDDPDGLFMLPSKMQELRGPLQLYLDHLFRESAFHDSFFFRGLYFSGDAGEDSQQTAADAAALLADPLAPGAQADEDFLAGPADPFAPRPELPAQVTGPRRPAFVKDLFEKKIFNEDTLARPLARTLLSRNRTVLAAQLLSLAIPIVGLVGLLFTYGGLELRAGELYDLLSMEARDLEEVKIRRLTHGEDGLGGDINGDYTRRPSSYAPARGGARAVPALLDGARTAGADDVGAREGGAEYLTAQARGDAYELEPQVGDAKRGVKHDETQDNEQHLLTAMAKVNARNYYSVFIPSSWFSNLNAETRRSLIDGFRYEILEGLALGLQERTNEFLYAEPITDLYERGGYDDAPRTYEGAADAPSSPRAPDAGDASPLYDQPFRAGADASLHGLVKGFGELIVNRERYATLISKDRGTLEEFRALAVYLDHDWPEGDFDPNNELYLSALRAAHGKPLKPDSDEVEFMFAEKVAEMVNSLYERSFERRTGGVRYDHLGDIALTETLLSRPEHRRLAGFHFAPRSPFHDMTLRAGLGELRKALEGLMGEKFMDGRSGAPRQLFVRRHLVWEPGLLRQALTLCNDYERFDSERGSSSRKLDEDVRQSALARLRANVSELVVRAQRYEPAPQLPGESARRASLAAEVRNLEQAKEPLSQLLDATERLGINVGLSGALASQSSYILDDVNQEFWEGHFYSAASSNFDWWNGEGTVSLRAFDADNADALAAYLESERKRISYLARELALPVFTFASSKGIRVAPLRGGRPVEWDRILSELERFDNKQPGGSIAALEEFITKGMDRANVEDCAPLETGGGERLDFFIRRRNELRGRLYGRCTVLANARRVERDALARRKADAEYMRDEEESLRALDNYRDIAAEFERSLAGRFPFADAPGGVPLAEVEPSAVIRFFELFDKKKAAAREAISRNRQLGSAGEEAWAFLDRMDGVRAFFATYLEKKQGPLVDFQFQFRSNREMESPGARQIIDWTLDVGRRKYGQSSQESPGRWIVGEPVSLTLRWANDSPSVPSVTSDSATLRARGRVATFEFKNRWALLALMQHQATSSGDFQYGVDTLPYTLKFVVPTRPDIGNRSDLQHPDLVGPDAQFYISLSLAAPGTKEPLVLPTFPAWAPKF